jgi:flavin-dependent dehydrogenase
MWLLEPDAAYAFPNDDGVTLLLCMPSQEKLPAFKKDLEGNFARFLEGLPEGPRLAGAERVSKFMGATNLENRSRPAATSGLAFVGDAALWSDPLWGIGCGCGPSSPPNGSRRRPPLPWRAAATSKGR